MIGTPSTIYYKSEETNKLTYNESLQGLPNTGQQNDYFFNYMTLGVVSDPLSLWGFGDICGVKLVSSHKDLLFNAETNRLSKIILNSNFPSHYNFNR